MLDYATFTSIISKEDQLKISKEYSRLDGLCYLDQVGCALYSKSHIETATKDLCENVYGNSHSKSLTGKLCADTVDQVRYRILQHFNTDVNEYSVIFTSGATAALKLVAESFLWHKRNKLETNDWHPEDKGWDNEENKGEFVYMEDNHTSVLGMREVVAMNGAKVRCLSHEQTLHTFNSSKITSELSSNQESNSLFVYSAQCNFSGVKYPLSWIEKVHDGFLENSDKRHSQWYCLLDAATYASTNQLDLSIYKPDFVSVSFYKIFGYPTGLGALIVRNASAHMLQKRYYGGGTVLIALSSQNLYVPRPLLHERFEDGTLNFLSIISLQYGFSSLYKLVNTMENVSRHTFSLAQYVFKNLLCLHHSNGAPAVKLYTDSDYTDINSQGNIVNFNMLRPNGEFIGYVEVQNMANLYGIQLRTGCFCNPGACRRHLNLSLSEVKSHYEAGHVCGDDKDLIEGKPTGSVRISFGISNTKEDADKLISMLVKCFASQPTIYKLPQEWDLKSKLLNDKFTNHFEKVDRLLIVKYIYLLYESLSEGGGDNLPTELCKLNENNSLFEEERGVENSGVGLPSLSHMFVYPIKSCGAFQTNKWKLDSKGLKYDRLWMVTNHSGVALTQKREPKLCLIKPVIDLKSGKLHLTFPGYPSCSVDLTMDNISEKNEVSKCQSKVCGDKIEGIDCGEKVATWLSEVMDRPGLRLIQQLPEDSRSKKESSGSLSLSNQAQYLLINKASINWLAEQIDDDSDCSKDSLVSRFRSNFVISGLEDPFVEQSWSQLMIGGTKFKVEGPCRRCQMICIDQETGIQTKEPLTTISAAFQGKLLFGIYLTRVSSNEEDSVTVTDKVTTFESDLND